MMDLQAWRVFSAVAALAFLALSGVVHDGPSRTALRFGSITFVLIFGALVLLVH
jgi:hypothetical protein